MTMRGGGQFALIKVSYFMDVLGRVYQLKADALAMAACREAPALDDCDLVRHVGVLRIMSDAVHAALGNNLARLELLRHGGSYRYIDLLWQQAGGQRCSGPLVNYTARSELHGMMCPCSARDAAVEKQAIAPDHAEDTGAQRRPSTRNS